jgi:hypothetical protein
LDKAKLYLEMFIATQELTQASRIMAAFDMDRHKLLAYFARVFSPAGLNLGADDLQSILERLAWKFLDPDQELYALFEKKLAVYLATTLFPNLGSTKFLQLVERMFASKLCLPTEDTLSLVMLKLTETNRRFDLLADFFEKCLVKHSRLSTLEPVVLMESMSANAKASSPSQLTTFMEFMEESYDSDLLDNFALLAKAMSGDVGGAERLHARKLKAGGKLDLQVLARFAGQLEQVAKLTGADSVRRTVRKYAGRLGNLRKLDSVQKDRKLLGEIEAILSKLNASTDKKYRGL